MNFEVSDRTSLHIFAATGKAKALKRALSSQQNNLLQVDKRNRTILHYAAEYANPKRAIDMVMSILSHRDVEELIQTGRGSVVKGHTCLLNFKDSDGNTALHVAATEHNAQVALLLIEKGADLTIKNNKGESAIELIYRNVPSVMKTRYDQAITCRKGQKADEVLLYELNFGEILLRSQTKKRDSNLLAPETETLFHALEADRKRQKVILEHPLVQMFLCMKWQKIRVLIWISIFYHAVWLTLFSMFVHDIYVANCPFNTSCKYVGSFLDNKIGHCKFESLTYTGLLSFGLLTFSVTIVAKEIYELWEHKWKYFLDLENLFQWSVVIATVIGLLPFIEAFPFSFTGGFCIKPVYYKTSAVGIFLAWGVMLRQLAKIPKIGAYIEIFMEVVKGFALFTATFFSLFIGFALALQILLPKHKDYDDFFWGATRLLVMMADDPSYDELFHGDEDAPFLVTTKLLYLLFVLLVIVILFNLLIAVTVSDTQKLQQNTEVRRLANQLKTVHLMQTFILSPVFQCCCQSLIRQFMVVPRPQDLNSHIVKIPQSQIPSRLQTCLKEIAIQYDAEDNDDETPLNTPVYGYQPIFTPDFSLLNFEESDSNQDLKRFMIELFQEYETRQNEKLHNLLKQFEACNSNNDRRQSIA